MTDFSTLFDALNNPVPTTDWSITKGQPLEMALMAKAGVESIEICYEFYPEALTKRMFTNVVKHGAKPGVVGFLASKCPHLVDDQVLQNEADRGPGNDSDGTQYSNLFDAINNPLPSCDWKISSHQPLELFLMDKAELGTIKAFYEFFPQALTKRLFVNVIKCGAKPGVVGFLVTKRPDLADTSAFELAVMQGPGPSRPTDSEIYMMASANNPELLVPTGPNFWMPPIWSHILNWKYSPELTRSLFKMIVGTTKALRLRPNIFHDFTDFPWVVIDEHSTTKRSALDMDVVLSMTPMLNSHSIRFAGSGGNKWEPDAFLEFFSKILSKQDIDTIDLNFPNLSQEHQEEVLFYFTTDEFNQLLSTCKVKKLGLRIHCCPLLGTVNPPFLPSWNIVLVPWCLWSI
ncbi:expressed unknown protein [Seminavis robusta]|uniref:Uncharacterized protein n=1 Tax=Seminavis robusta TaxID=568900 RepID=A0A9N8HSH6_9STRA|nr:expressed unknown protein [Seminavis robusta]|eukprot:Sro1386_g268311.1  (402) ;mRNA; r:23908-25113